MIVIAKKGSDCVSKTTAALAGANCKHKKVSSQELSDNYSMLKFDDSYEGVLDLEAGILHADKCLAKLQVGHYNCLYARYCALHYIN